MPRERLLDVSGQEPPQPFVHITEALDSLQPGEYLRVRHHREPFPLYAQLPEWGFRYLVRPGHGCAFEIFIWRDDDRETGAAVQRLAAARD